MEMSKGVKKDVRVKKTIDPGNLMIVVYLLVICLVLLVGTFTGAQASVPEQAIKIEDVSRGELLFVNPEGILYPAPDLSRSVSMEISGLTARVMVKQRFENRTDRMQEAVYVFPLPAESGVDTLRMDVGGKKISGVIREKEEARKIYQQAKATGKKSSLLVQKRPNMFTTKVASIGAGETVTIEIEYQQQVRYVDGVFSLRFPLAITPRYMPQSPQSTGVEGEVVVNEDGWNMDTFVKPFETQRSPIAIDIDLDAGMELCCVESVYHKVDTKKEGLGHYAITLNKSEQSVHDFVLEWQGVQGRGVNAALFSEQRGDAQYSLLMLVPPLATTSFSTVRELLFVVDISGSMAGESMEQAQESVLYALDRLNPTDSFNIIVFNNTTSSLFAGPVEASPHMVGQAKNFIRSLNANGGTEMVPALQQAFASRRVDNDENAISQIVFITDGAVSNEEQLFSMINNMVGSSRIFTVGIGSAPNSYFMSRAATMGRGTFTYVGKPSEVQAKMGALFEKLEKPAMINITVKDKDGQPVEYFPSRIPDIYSGEPLAIAVKTSGETEDIEVEGVRQGQPWSVRLRLQKGVSHAGIASLWARQKIKSLMDERLLGGDEKQLRGEITAVALKYQLVSKYTSLVAVEEAPEKMESPARIEDRAKLQNVKVMTAPIFYAGAAQTATPAELLRILGLAIVVIGLFLLVYTKRAGHVSGKE